MRLRRYIGGMGKNYINGRGSPESGGSVRGLQVASSEQICKELEAFYKESYASAFIREDVAAIAESFACPCALITGQQGFDPYSTESDIQHVFGRFLADLKERGWVRSEIERIKTWPMAEDLAMILADVTRYKADGSSWNGRGPAIHSGET